MFKELNNHVLWLAAKLRYEVKDNAPNNERELFSSSSLIIWSGASDATVWNDERVNWAFRALHDAFHLKTKLGFSPNEEIMIARLQASQYDGLLADIVFIEVAKQAEYFKVHGEFPVDQKTFVMEHLKKAG